MMALKEAIEKVDKAVKHADEVAKKLTTKDRKKLKSTTFCGPNRSYPVNDCAHYTAALRLLSRGKYSAATKAKIKSCIIRRGKAMGCVKKEKSADIEELIKSYIFKTTVESVEQSIKNPGIDLAFDESDLCEEC